VVPLGLRQAPALTGTELGVGFAVSSGVDAAARQQLWGPREAAMVLRVAGVAASYVPARGALGWICCPALREE
jgi:hypothetical protein